MRAFLKVGRKALDVLGGGEGGEGDDAGGVIDEGDEVGLAPGSVRAGPWARA